MPQLKKNPTTTSQHELKIHVSTDFNDLKSEIKRKIFALRTAKITNFSTFSPSSQPVI